MNDGHTIDVGYAHVLEASGASCVPHCPHPDHTARVVDSSSDEGMLREAHDLLRLATFPQMPARWLADDLVQRIAARFPEPADVIDPKDSAATDRTVRGGA